jgi:DNA-binding NtrC family response regulator
MSWAETQKSLRLPEWFHSGMFAVTGTRETPGVRMAKTCTAREGLDAGYRVGSAFPPFASSSTAALMKVTRTLVVEDDDLLARAISRELRQWCAAVDVASRCDEAEPLLGLLPSLVLVDVCLPDGSGVDVVRKAARLSPKPRIIALSARASAEEGFALAKAGACAYMPKPISLDSLLQTIERVLAMPVDLMPEIADAVGTVKFEALHDQMKSTMIHQALGMTGHNITKAAELLGVSRQRLQQWIRLLEIEVAPKADSSRDPN